MRADISSFAAESPSLLPAQWNEIDHSAYEIERGARSRTVWRTVSTVVRPATGVIRATKSTGAITNVGVPSLADVETALLAPSATLFSKAQPNSRLRANRAVRSRGGIPVALKSGVVAVTSPTRGGRVWNRAGAA
jgi:hypothetical protein